MIRATSRKPEARRRSGGPRLLTAVYREGEMLYAAETSFLGTLADQSATAAANARLLTATRQTVMLKERQRLAPVPSAPNT